MSRLFPLLLAASLGGCVTVLDDDGSLTVDPTTSTEAKPLDLRAPPPGAPLTLDVAAEAQGPNVVVVTATFSADVPLTPRLDVPGGARVLSGGAVGDGIARWLVRPPMEGSHAYGVTVTDGDRVATESVRCCGPQGSVDSLGGT